MEKKKQRFPLALKMNLLIAGMILIISATLVTITYQTYRRKINEIYYDEVEKLAMLASSDLSGDFVRILADLVRTEEYRSVHAEAVEKQDPEIIRAWLKEQESSVETNLQVVDSETGERMDVEDPSITADTIYDSLYDVVAEERNIFDVASVYIQYDDEDVTYNILDSAGDLLTLGTIEPPMPEFEPYGENEDIPATIVYMDGRWVCTACVSALSWDDGSICGLVGADITMDEVREERGWFLWNCLTLIIILTVAFTTVAMILFRRMTVKPLVQLADAAAKFGSTDSGLTAGDVTTLDIRSHDEIGELYEEIRSMEMRIVDSAGHLAQAAAEKERTRTELENAAQIQAAMLPGVYRALPEREEYDLYASMTPAREVGGDFYDYFMQDEDHLVMVIADVSGKGMPAALYMMASKILMKERGRSGETPAEILASVNNRLIENNPYQMFVTAWVGILDLRTGKMQCSSAGHEYPAIQQGDDGKFVLLHDKHGFVLGVRENLRYRNYEIQLQEGSAIFVYTDGVKEATNAKEELFRTDRMIEALNRDADGSPEQLLANVRAAVDDFVGEAPQFDDLTMLAVRYHGKKKL